MRVLGLGVRVRALGLVMWVEGQVRVRARYPPRFSKDYACGVRVLGLGVRGEGPWFSHAG